MAAIDIGAAAIDRANSTASGRTRVDRTNPANDTGKITSVEMWANTNISNCEVATFYVVSGDNLSTRDTETIGSVTAGSKQTFSGLNMDVQTGDYIGAYWTSGDLEADGGGSGYYQNGDQIPCTNVAFSAGTSYYSLYGTGETAVTEKFSSDTGSGVDAKEGYPAVVIIKPDTGSGLEAVVSLQTPAAKTSSDAGSGAEGTPTQSAVIATNESGSGIEALIARMLTSGESGSAVEAADVDTEEPLKNLFASEVAEGADRLVAKIEIPVKGGGMKLWT